MVNHLTRSSFRNLFCKKVQYDSLLTGVDKKSFIYIYIIKIIQVCLIVYIT